MVPLKRQSIARRLVVTSIVWSLAILLLAGIILATIDRRSTEHAFDERLHVYLKSLVADVASPNETERSDPYGLGEPRFDLPLSGWYWQITRIDREPREIRGSTSLFGGRLPSLAAAGVRPRTGELREGYGVGPDERRLRIVERVIDLGDDGRFLIQVGADADEIEQAIAGFRWAVGLTFGLLALALAATTLFQVRFGLQPLARLSSAVGAIRRGETDHIDGQYPDDIAPLAAELNLLLDANREILERARTQVGNLAHALKTPLSVIVNEAAAGDGPLADKVREQTTIMRDQVSWYLERARAAARAGSIGTATDVAPVVEGIVRTLTRIHVDRGLAFSADVALDIRFRGERQDLEEMVGNLVDNAGKWADTRVSVTAAATEAREGRPFLLVTVDDDGPGLPQEARARMLRRGARLDESKPGSGLGLSIVADLASLYGGKLELGESPLRGVRASLWLPAV
jgi:signal transduction histidine kinase